MTDKQTPPDWAFKRAQELRNKRGFTHLDAFAAYIAEHEQPPVDRKVLCAREAMAEGCTLPESEGAYRRGAWDNAGALKNCLRAIELYESGFGK